MKKILFILFSVPLMSHAFDTSVKGFIALDALNYKKIEGKKSGAVVGIGVLDLKVFAEQDNMTAALKLDLDGKIAEENNIFEEAYATYRGIRDFRFSLGKGVVRFQNLHWGSVQNTYYDGGTVLGTENSFRKLSKKAYASVSYGHRSRGFLNTFWFFGDSSEISYNEDGTPKYTFSGNYVTSYKSSPVTAFDTSHQTGFANRIEIYKIENWTFSNGLVYYKKDVQKNPTWAIDFGINYEDSDIEFWSDILVGHTNKLPYESYSTYSNNEYFIQLGVDKFINQDWSWVTNTEFLYTANQSWVYPSTINTGGTTTSSVDRSFTERSGQLVKTTSYKIETSGKYKLSKSSFVTVGGLYENKTSSKNGVKNLSSIPSVYNPNRQAFQLLTSVSFWF
jgi:hypothetical protein